MNDNDEVVDETQEATTEEQEVNESGASAEPDWKELLRLERENTVRLERDRDNYREGLLSHKRKDRQERTESTSDIDEKIKKGIEEVIAPLTEALQGNRFEQILASVISDPSKRAYVKELYETRVQRTGTSEGAIRSDLETALAIADSKKIAKENSELKRMNDNRTYIPPNAGGGSADRGNVTKKPYKWSPEQEAMLETRARNAGIADVEKYKSATWQQFQKGSAFDVQQKPKSI